MVKTCEKMKRSLLGMNEKTEYSENEVVKCPSCGEVMRKRQSGMKYLTILPRAYECVNEKCPIIEIRFRYSKGRKNKTLMDISITRDPTVRLEDLTRDKPDANRMEAGNRLALSER